MGPRFLKPTASTSALPPERPFRFLEGLGTTTTFPKSVVYIIGPAYASIYRYLNAVSRRKFRDVDVAEDTIRLHTSLPSKARKAADRATRPLVCNATFEDTLELVGVDFSPDVFIPGIHECSSGVLGT
jgi:hypothetical protein